LLPRAQLQDPDFESALLPPVPELAVAMPPEPD